jgi:16S rRNA (uracil1498-N3)-methyltransferase
LITLLADPASFDRPEIRVEGEAYRHLFRARRVETGARMRVVDGRGRARWGEVARVDRSSAAVELREPAPTNEPAFRLELLVPTCRPERASWLVEKATEVGVCAVRFLNTARAPRDFGAGTLERLRRVAAAAVEQCHRALLPDVTGPHSWQEVGTLTASCGDCRWFLDPGPAGSGWGEVSGASGALILGPEGGLDPHEREELQRTGWRPVRLGERILRLETAALVGAAMILLSPVSPDGGLTALEGSG